MNGEIIENVCNDINFYAEIDGCSPRWELWGIINNYKKKNH